MQGQFALFFVLIAGIVETCQSTYSTADQMVDLQWQDPQLEIVNMHVRAASCMEESRRLLDELTGTDHQVLDDDDQQEHEHDDNDDDNQPQQQHSLQDGHMSDAGTDASTNLRTFRLEKLINSSNHMRFLFNFLKPYERKNCTVCKNLLNVH